MKLILTNVREIKRNASPLTKAVCGYIIRRWGDYQRKTDILKTVIYHGCQSGAVSELIYSTDIVAFYTRYRQEIHALLYEYMRETGIYPPLGTVPRLG